MAERNSMSIGVIALGDGTVEATGGPADTRAKLLTDGDAMYLPIGSVYFSHAGKVYVRVAKAGAETDWERVTTTAAD